MRRFDEAIEQRDGAAAIEVLDEDFALVLVHSALAGSLKFVMSPVRRVTAPRRKSAVAGNCVWNISGLELLEFVGRELDFERG